MPFIHSRQTTEKPFAHAHALLQVLIQLHPKDALLLVASQSGELLATSPGAADLLPAATGDNAVANIRPLLGLEEEAAFVTFEEELARHKKVSGVISLANRRQSAYTCQQVQFQDHTFLCLELAGCADATQDHQVADDSYHNVFDESMEPLFILDGEGNFIDINRSGLELVQQQKENLIGKSIFRNFDLNLFERVALRNQLQTTLQGEPQRFEWWLHERDQELLPVEVSLRRGVFDGEVVIFGSAKNLYEAVGAERNVRFRNHQLEFVNHLITNLSVSGSREDVLRYTLNELLEKSDVVGGAVYAYAPAEEKALLSYSAGVVSTETLPAAIPLTPAQVEQLATAERRRVVQEINHVLEEKLGYPLTVVPVTTDTNLIALLLVWPGHQSKITQSFVSLLDFISSAIGNYISKHELLQQLSNTEDKYKLVFEASYDAILLFRDGVVVECNEKALQYFRCNREDLIGKSPTDYSPEYQPDGMLSSVKTDMLMEQLMTTGEPITVEWKNLRKDGVLVDAEINLNRIMIDGQFHVLAFKRDITQRKQIQSAKRREEIARESMAHFRSFLEKVNLIYYSLDTAGNIAYANDYFLKYVEYSREELIGQNFYELLVPETEREVRLRDFRKSLETRQLNSYYERDVITKSGQVKTMRWNCMFEYGPEG